MRSPHLSDLYILTHLKVQGIASLVTSSLVLSFLLQQHRLDHEKILMDFPATTSSYNGNIKIQHNVTHHIESKGPPVCAKLRPLAPEQLNIAKPEFQRMLEHGIIRPSSANWASPLHMLAKKIVGDRQPCGDYSALKNTTILDRYPILHIFRTSHLHCMEQPSFPN